MVRISSASTAGVLSTHDFSVSIPPGWSDRTAALRSQLGGGSRVQVVLVGPVSDVTAWNLVIGDRPNAMSSAAASSALPDLAAEIEAERQTQNGATNPTYPVGTRLGAEPAEVVQFDIPGGQHSAEIVCQHRNNLWELVLTSDNNKRQAAMSGLAELASKWRWIS